MIGSEIKITIGEKTGPEGIHILAAIDNEISSFELLAAVATLVGDGLTISQGELDIEDFVRVIRIYNYESIKHSK